MTGTNRDWATGKTGWLLAVAAVLIVAGGAWGAEAPTPAQRGDADMAAEAEPQETEPGRYVPGQVIVKLKDGSTADPTRLHEAALSRLQTRYGLADQGPVFPDPGTATNAKNATGSKRRARQRDASRFRLLTTERDIRTVCAELRNDPEVDYAQPNYIYRTCAVPNDPDFPDQYAHQLIQMPDAWDISTGSHDVVVAVLDTGVDVNHPDLKDNIWVNQGEIPDNDIDDDENGYVDDVKGWNFESDNNQVVPETVWYDIEGHGTMVSGVIAAVGNNDEGVSGVNWQCSIMPLRVGVYMTSDEVAEGLDYAAANGADILNMSFGADEFGPEGDPLLKEALDNAFDQGVLLVASAGNSNTDQALYPAAHYNIMAVSSTNGEDTKTGHSMYGPWVDIAAPGTDIVTTDLNGEYIATAGTSFSAPYVAAVGALVLSHRPELTNVELRAILENTTDPVYYGQVDPERCYIGTGRVNAYTALLNADVRYPLGEIVAPQQAESLVHDANAIDLVLFVHGDSYRVEYSHYGDDDWTVIGEGDGPVDPNGLVQLSFIAPDASVYDLRLSVTTEGMTHIDRKVFGVGSPAEQEHWPKPAEAVDLPEYQYYGNAICMDVNGDGRNEIIQSALSWATYWGEAQLGIWREDGTSLPGWPVALPEAYDPPICAVGDIDGDGDYEIVGTCNYDDLVYAWHVESGELVDGDWPLPVGDYWSSVITSNPILADLDGDGDSEIIVALDSESSDADSLYAIHGDGSFLWQRRYMSTGQVSVADFDQNGDVEIALCGYGPGMSNIYTYILDDNGQQIKRWRGGSNKGTVIGDLDGDGQTELVFCTEDNIQAVRIDGSIAWTTPINDPFDGVGTMSIGDIDDDGYGEVYVSNYVEADGFSFTVVYALDHRGKLLTDRGFPKSVMGYPAENALLIGDIDGDAGKELLVAVSGTPVMAWESDGSTTPGFPMLDLLCEEYCAATLNDLDQDGDIELIVGGYDYRFHVVDLPGQYDPGTIDWGMLRHDAQCSGSMALGPILDPIAAPDQIMPGQRLEFELHASNPGNQLLRFVVGNMPEGAHFDEETLTVSWKPTTDQVFHTGTFSFLVTDGIRQSSRSALIAVVPDAIYHADMETDPNWQLDDGWAWGTPAGGGSWNGDPNAGYTGDHVIGYALEGDYDDNIPAARYATTGPIDCQGYANIRLSFRRWLGVESPYDDACIQVSNDGVTWVNVWTVGTSHISDRDWHFVEYEVPAAVADGQPTVYFRWGLGPTDESVVYAGWNIDDIQVTGDRLP